jgi:ethanolamine utilization protein EutA
MVVSGDADPAGARPGGALWVEALPDDARGQDDEDLTANPIWQQENVVLRSVGIDIGSSGTQVVFSLLRLRRDGSALSPRFTVVARECLFESRVNFTPFAADGRIDAAGVGAVIDEAYEAAALTPADVDTGVVILTGEALARENAERLADVVAATAGDFVVAAAGHHLEATLAAHGSGTVARSAATGQTLLNVDIGGGTTKLSVVAGGTVTSTAALHLGGRLVVVGPDAKVVRLEPAAARLADEVGIRLALGSVPEAGALDALAEHMADRLVAELCRRGALPRGDWLALTEPVRGLEAVQAVTFSGGVAEYIEGREQRDFGDLGRRLGEAVARRLRDGTIPWSTLRVEAPIRATVLGASEFCVQLSGTTCFVSDPQALLPRRNVPVVRPALQLGQDIDVAEVATEVRQAADRYDANGLSPDVVVAVAWRGELSHRRLAALARGLVSGMAGRLERGRPLLVALDGDVGRSLGAIVHEELGVPTGVLVVDGLDLRDFDFIDIGRPREPSGALPVTIKSLVFPGAGLEGPGRDGTGPGSPKGERASSPDEGEQPQSARRHVGEANGR